jgi:5-deoxy-glucuronate isomerase
MNNKILPNIGFSLLTAESGNIYRANTGFTELCLVILSGRWKIKVKGEKAEYNCERTSVFEEKAYALYLPRDTGYELVAEKEGEVAFCESNGSKKGEPVFITPTMVKERHLGRDTFQRTAFDILDETITASSLLVGETISEPGHWSSYPPHKHDTDNPPQETALEELYYFRFKPSGGFGFQRIYSEDHSLNESFMIEDSSVVLIPSGYHPVASAPGYSLYYLWILAGKKRILQPFFDPRYKWIND